jgi:transcriptional regulator with XRE-family HTH domain
MELTRWLSLETERRNWSHDELNQKAGLAPGTVDRVLAGESTPGWEFCLKVSWALNESPEKLFRLAGLLPSLPPAIEEELEAISLLRSLPGETRQNVISLLRDLVHGPQVTQARAPAGSESEPGDVDPERAERIRRLAKHITRLPNDYQEQVIEAFLMLLEVKEEGEEIVGRGR